MSRFVENAVKMLEAAEAASQSGCALSDMTVLVSREGGIQLLADSDWPLESLALDRGSQMAYRVSQNRQGVRIEGRAGMQTCRLECTSPRAAARLLLAGL